MDSFRLFFHRVLFSESVEDLISNEMSHKKFQSDKNYRFFIVRIYRLELGIMGIKLIKVLKLFPENNMKYVKFMHKTTSR